MASAADLEWMRRALDLAASGAKDGEVPVGAVVVRRGECIGEGANSPIGSCDPTAHAEILALRAAAQRLGSYRLNESTLYVTLEPCAMCAGAMIHARLDRVVFGASDPKSGAAGGALDVLGCRALNHRVAVDGAVLEDQCAALLRAFFAERR